MTRFDEFSAHHAVTGTYPAKDQKKLDDAKALEKAKDAEHADGDKAADA